MVLYLACVSVGLLVGFLAFVALVVVPAEREWARENREWAKHEKEWAQWCKDNPPPRGR